MDKYLLDILKESNTIIIPGLGALTITNKETGETMFMPYLQHDDGKLAAFIAEKDGIEESDAKNMVAKYVREIHAELGKGESYSMFELGTFMKLDDGDIEFTHWSNLGSTEETSEASSIEEKIIIADEPIVESESIPEPESIEIEPTLESDPVIEPEPVVIPEPSIEVETNVESESIIEPDSDWIEPIIEPEDISEPIVNEIDTPEFDSDEIEIKNAIEEALESAPKVAPIVTAIDTPEIPKEVVIPEVTLEPSPVVENFVGASPIEEEIVTTEPLNEEEKDEEKEKPSAKFWIYLILVAIVIIGGGAYIGRNYNELKQKIPFLADEKAEVKSKAVMDEMDEIIKEYEAEQDSVKENQDGLDEGDSENGMEDNTPTESKLIEKPEPLPTPISTSSGGHYHIIAGAFSSIDNANKLAKEFKAKGLGSSVVQNGSLNAVSMQSYATSAEANADLSKMNAIVPGAWILYK